jgi:hypothetical protein
MSRFHLAFGALVLAQAAHSVEEYIGRLWETFPPARILPALISQDLSRGFLLLNVFLVVFGVWCWLWPIRRGWGSAPLYRVGLDRGRARQRNGAPALGSCEGRLCPRPDHRSTAAPRGVEPGAERRIQWQSPPPASVRLESAIGMNSHE